MKEINPQFLRVVEPPLTSIGLKRKVEEPEAPHKKRKEESAVSIITQPLVVENRPVIGLANRTEESAFKLVKPLVVENRKVEEPRNKTKEVIYSETKSFYSFLKEEYTRKKTKEVIYLTNPKAASFYSLIKKAFKFQGSDEDKIEEYDKAIREGINVYGRDNILDALGQRRNSLHSTFLFDLRKKTLPRFQKSGVLYLPKAASEMEVQQALLKMTAIYLVLKKTDPEEITYSLLDKTIASTAQSLAGENRPVIELENRTEESAFKLVKPLVVENRKLAIPAIPQPLVGGNRKLAIPAIPQPLVGGKRKVEEPEEFRKKRKKERREDMIYLSDSKAALFYRLLKTAYALKGPDEDKIRSYKAAIGEGINVSIGAGINVSCFDNIRDVLLQERKSLPDSFLPNLKSKILPNFKNKNKGTLSIPIAKAAHIAVPQELLKITAVYLVLQKVEIDKITYTLLDETITGIAQSLVVEKSPERIASSPTKLSNLTKNFGGLFKLPDSQDNKLPIRKSSEIIVDEEPLAEGNTLPGKHVG